jgi:hypothetical protein
MRHAMRGRIISLLVLIGLLFGAAVMPAMAEASGHLPAHAGDVVDTHTVDDDHQSLPDGDDRDMPCHTVSHHHCSIALEQDGPRIALSAFPNALRQPPASAAPLLSRSLAPPLDPPNA